MGERALDVIDHDAIIHPMAVVIDSEVGSHTRIWQFASVIRGAKIGSWCSVAATAVVDGAVVGDRTIVSNGAHVNPGTWVGEDVFIGPHVVLCNDAWPRVSKEGFNLEVFKETVVVKIHHDASIGANAVVLPGVTIGFGAMIAAGSVVDRDVPKQCIFRKAGTIEKISKENLSRRIREIR